MVIATSSAHEDLFYEELIRPYNENPRFIARPWLANRIDEALADPACRFLLLTADPGAGKTAFMAWLAHQHPTWPRYFIRRNQLEPLDDPGAHSLLLRIGFQLEAAHPMLFTREEVRVVVEQRIGSVGLSGEAVAAEIERVFASPFYRKVLHIQQQVERNDGKVTGLHVGEWVTEPRVLYLDNLQHMALIDPARVLLKDEPGELLVILVDALDELRYHRYGHTEQTILSWLEKCPTLPPNVRFVLTSRPDEALMSPFRMSQQRWFKEITLAAADPDFLKDLQTYALVLTEEKAMKAAMEAIGKKRDDFVNLAVQKASGNIGYLDAVCRALDQAVSRQDQEALSQLLDLTQLSDTLEGLYTFFLRQTKEIVEKVEFRVEDKEGEVHYLKLWPEVYLRILGVLVAARVPLTASQIQRLGTIQASWNEFSDALNALRQFLNRSGEHYYLYHATLIEFLTASETQQTPETRDLYLDEKVWHRRIATYYQNWAKEVGWGKGKDDEHGLLNYGLLYYALHLYLAQEWQRLFAVLNEGEYGRAKIKHNFNALAYARDLELGQQATLRNELSSEEKIDLLPALWRYCLLRSSMGTQSDNYPNLAFVVMVMLKQYQRAIAAVELISDDHRKVWLLINIGVKLEEQGQKEPAQQVLKQAKDVLATNMQSDPAVLQTILQEIAELGPFGLKVPFLSEIASMVQLIEDEEQRTTALVAVIVALAHAEARETAKALACTIPYTALNGRTREKIVETLVKAELWESATLIAQSIVDDKRARDSAMEEVIIGLLRVQAWKEARELALTTDLSERFRAMAQIALTRVLVEPQMAGELLTELATVPLPSDKESDREHARSVTSQVWARAQQWDKAINIVQSMHDSFWAASQALEQMLKAQQWDKARELASSLPSSYEQIELLDSLVKTLIAAEQLERSRDAIAKVVQAILRQEQNIERPDDGVLLKVATLLIKLQLWDDAQQVTEQMKDPKQQGQALAAIADALFQEQPARARQLIFRAESITSSLKKPDEEAYGYDPERIGSILCAVVGVLARMQLWDRAIALANTISARWLTNHRDEAFAAIVVASGRAKVWKQALSIAQNIESDEGQSDALKAVVEDLLYWQEWQQALKVTQTIKQPEQRFEMLIALIKKLMFVQRMSLRERTEPLDTEDELPSSPFDAQLSEEEEHLWDDTIAAAQQLFDKYRSPEALVEMLQDLAIVQQWDRALKIVDIPALAEYRAKLLVVIVHCMLDAAQWKRALALARSIDAPVQKAEALVSLAAVHIEEQPQQAESLLNEALAAALLVTDDDEDRSEAVASLAFALNKVGRWEKALAIARSIHEPLERIKVQVNIAVARKDSEPEQAVAILSDALAFVRSLRSVEQEEPLEVIAKALPLLLKIKQAHALYAEFLSFIATALRSYGEVERAAHLEELAGTIASFEQEEQNRALAEFETLFGELNSTQVRNPYAVKNTDGEEQVEDTGEDDLFEWRGRSRKQEKKDQGLRSKVWSSIQDRQPERAADMLLEHMASKNSFNESEWSTLQRDVAGGLARKQQLEKALAIAWSIREEWQKTQALGAIAKALVNAGQRDKAQLLLVKTEALAHSIKDGRERDNALGDVANTLAQIQEPDEAQVVVGFIKDSMQREVPRLRITRALALAQRWDEAKEEARRIEGILKISAMHSITDAMITYGEHEQALQYIQTAWIQAEARRELIKLLPLAEEFIPLHPELGEGFYDAFAWVDHFLQA